MKYLGLIWKGVWRKKIRTSLTILSVFVAFLLFAMLSAVAHVFSAGSDAADPSRMIVTNSVTLINPLPLRYKNEIAATPGVASVTFASWFGGYYQDPRNQVSPFPTEPRAYFKMYPEFNMPEEQLDAWAKDRIGIVAGKPLADKYGWKIGDRIPLQTTIWTNKDGNQTWEFTLDGIFTTDDPRGNASFMLFNHDYFDEARAFGEGTIGWYILRITDGANPAEVANAIDSRFANSPQQTETSTEQAFAVSFARQLGDIVLMVTLVLCAVFFTLLLVSGSTMSQSVRERIPELAVLKTLGFPDRAVLRIVLTESILIMLIGGLIGIGVGWLAVQVVAKSSAGAQLPGLFVSPQIAVLAVVLMIVAGIAAGIFPAMKAMRLSIVAALARG